MVASTSAFLRALVYIVHDCPLDGCGRHERVCHIRVFGAAHFLYVLLPQQQSLDNLKLELCVCSSKVWFSVSTAEAVLIQEAAVLLCMVANNILVDDS